ARPAAASGRRPPDRRRRSRYPAARPAGLRGDRPGPHQPDRERAQVHPARHPDPRGGPPPGRYAGGGGGRRRAGHSGRCAPAPVRQVLPGREWRGAAEGHGPGPGGGAGAGEGARGAGRRGQRARPRCALLVYAAAGHAAGAASDTHGRGGIGGGLMAGRGARILVVDDEPEILRAVRTNLAAHGYDVLTATNATEAEASYGSRHPDLILLDLGLPDEDGLTLIEQIRAHAATPIVVLSARGAEHDKVRALDLGADDYLTKPFGMDELLARIRVALRHAAHPGSGAAPVFRCGDLAVDLERRSVSVGGREVKLTP